MPGEEENTVGTGSPEVPSTAPEVPATEGEATPPEETGASEAPEEDPANGEPAAEGEDSGKEGESGEEPELYWGDTPVDVEVPDDLRSELSEKGIDVDKAVAELYAKDGDFNLSDETRAAAEAAYGKSAVSAFLNSLKSQNEAQSFKNEVTAKEAKAAEEQAKAWSDELVGGEESWDAMAEWVSADESISDDEIASFNEAVQSSNKYIQELAIRDMHRRYTEANGDGDPVLVDGDSASRSSMGGPMTSADYMSEIARIDSLPHSERGPATAAADARRQAGINKGI